MNKTVCSNNYNHHYYKATITKTTYFIILQLNNIMIPMIPNLLNIRTPVLPNPRLA